MKEEEHVHKERDLTPSSHSAAHDPDAQLLKQRQECQYPWDPLLRHRQYHQQFR